MNTRMAITLKEFYDLLAVWELGEKGRWRFLELARLPRAITLCRKLKAEGKSERLVFPTSINPNQVLAKVPTEKKTLSPLSTLPLEGNLS